jgi:hypothetical protein
MNKYSELFREIIAKFPQAKAITIELEMDIEEKEKFRDQIWSSANSEGIVVVDKEFVDKFKREQLLAEIHFNWLPIKSTLKVK